MTFDTFFQTATGNPPYDYQRRLAGSDVGRDCKSLLIDIPTGLGKTAAVVLAWLWNRVGHPDRAHRDTWPRRLVICLPMRTLVEQTRDNVRLWLRNLGDLEWPPESDHAGKVGLHLLMGGEEAGEWDLHPEADAILIGTQDMLLSRALNRGYGAARARWPMHFGLLNNDCLWVLDETQLMGVGVRTSAQLEGLRQKKGTASPCATWWTSATLDKRLLATPDHATLPGTLELGDKDSATPAVENRVNAVKRLSRIPFVLSADSSKAQEPYLDQLAQLVADRHQPGTLTLVILNRVKRARGLFERLAKLAKKQTLPQTLLLHSRFRPLERAALSAQIRSGGEKIIISTQAIEAGVDLSARTLFTELAPRSSLVQRFGRCNRAGEFNTSGGADIFWTDLSPENEQAATDLALPYLPAQMARAREFLAEVEGQGASPKALAQIVGTPDPLIDSHILRGKDLVELFDTSPDLAGLDIDVGRYIRDGEERDVQVFWRKLPEKPEADQLDAIVPQRSELVRASVNDFRKFAEKKTGIWSWNALDGEWQTVRPDRIAPGQIYLVGYENGGYSAVLGWTGDKAREGFPVLDIADQGKNPTPRDGQDSDDETQASGFQSIEEHSAKVLAACAKRQALLPAIQPWAEALRTAALWHDLGKAHPLFQAFLGEGRELQAPWDACYLAKAPWRPGARHKRPHFRHELASALAWLAVGESKDEAFKNLVAYLIATHHGKIRLSIRAMPGEKAPDQQAGGAQPLFARGIWHGERLLDHGSKQLALAGIPTGPITLDLSCMKMGQSNGAPSWTARVISLRESPTLGIFRLALLEAVLRSADAEGSQQ